MKAEIAVKESGQSNGSIASKPTILSISPPKFKTAHLTVVGTSPLVQARFSAKAKQAMMAKMAAGSTAGKGKKRDPRNFDADFKEAMHISEEGWVGVPAAALRNACIDACRTVGFKMTLAKMSIRVEHDGVDAKDGMPLVKLDAGEPERTEMTVRNETGVVDVRIRPMWRKWKLHLRIQFDADQFTMEDVANLLARAGMQVGIGEGRPFSKNSNGQGWGTFEVQAGIHDQKAGKGK